MAERNKISASSSYASSGTLENRIETIAKAGFSHLNLPSNICKEIMVGTTEFISELKSLFEKNNLKIDWMHAPFHHGPIYSDNFDTWLLGVANFRMAVKACSDLGSKILVIHILDDYFFSQDTKPEINVANVEKAFELIVYDANKNGIRIAVENLPDPHAKDILTHLLDTNDALDFCFDIGHANLDNTIDFYLSKYADRTAALHLHDNMGQNDDHNIPGRGNIDFKSALEKLRDADYAGVWGLECLQTSDNYPGGLEAAHTIHQSISQLLNKS